MRLANLRSLAPSSFAAGLLACLLAGCGGSATVDSTPINTGPYSGLTFGGKAMAGKQPLIGASVQLYAAGATGNGSGSTALLTSALTTDANGAFTVPAGYTCSPSGSFLYVVARGGKPGSAASSANSAIILITAIGACNQIAASSQIVVNEVTTVAAAYALSQFLSPGANLGASVTNSAGLQNAFVTAAALADITQGVSPGPTFASNGSSPAARIDSLANLLNACAASTSGGAPCTSLFTATTIGASIPANTFDAALNLTRAPAASVVSLYTLSATSSAFTPVLAAAPADWTLFVNYTGGGMDLPTGLGIDSAGNVWVSSYFSDASLFSPLGKPLLGQGVTGFGLSASYGLAVDASNNAWIPNEPNAPVPGNSVTVLNSSGQSVAGSNGYTGGGLNFPIAVAIDPDTSVWVVDYGNSHLTHLSASGQPLSGSAGFTSAYLALPVAAAIDSSHNVWLANQSGASVTKVSPDGSQFTNFLCCDEPAGIAIDRLGNAWVTNYYSNSISEISSAGAIVSNQAYRDGGLDQPQGVAIDSANNVWITNFRFPTTAPGATITELAGASATTPGAALSPATGFGLDAGLLEPFAIAVDASGNLWITNSGNNTLTEFIGMAAPVRTPLIGPPATP